MLPDEKVVKLFQSQGIVKSAATKLEQYTCTMYMSHSLSYLRQVLSSKKGHHFIKYLMFLSEFLCQQATKRKIQLLTIKLIKQQLRLQKLQSNKIQHQFLYVLVRSGEAEGERERFREIVTEIMTDRPSDQPTDGQTGSYGSFTSNKQKKSGVFYQESFILQMNKN